MATTATEKPRLPPLKTPVSATSMNFPSELRTPVAGTPTFIKLEENLLKTPLSPPPAYLDFLKTLSPMLMSPASTTRTSFPDRPGPPGSTSSTDTVVTLASDADSVSTTTSLSRSTTSDSSASYTCTAGTDSNPASRSSSRSSVSRRSSVQDPALADLKVMIPPASPFVRPHSARTPRRILIPQSPRSTGSRTPLSAHSTIYSPFSAVMSPLSQVEGGELQSPQVPHSAPLYGTSKPVNVSVRQVVTRTIIYSSRSGNSAPVVDPVPASKKRKTEEGARPSSPSSTASDGTAKQATAETVTKTEPE